MTRFTTLTIASLASAGLLAVEPLVIPVDPAHTGRVFEGIGCLSAGASSRLLIDYPEPQRTEVLDYLFKPNFGAAFHHLKVEVGGDVNSTDGCEPSHMHTRDDQNYRRGYEWWLMTEARRRNPRIFLDALEWGAPAWIGNGDFNSQDNADYLANFLQGVRRTHGLTLDYVGIWNETRADLGFIKRLRHTLDRRGLPAVEIVAMDEINRWSLVDALPHDPELARAVSVVGTHYPKFLSTEAARTCGKRIWSSEDGPWKGTWEGARTLARIYNRNYILGRMTKTIIWSPVSAYYDILPLPGSGAMRANSPWSGHYQVQPAVWATAHTTQFAQPGWRYLDSACQLLPGGGSCVALLAPDNRDFSLILEAVEATNATELVFVLAPALTGRSLQAWRSNAEAHLTPQPDPQIENGRLTLTLEPGTILSLTTTSGQSKGRTDPPPPAHFPTRYREDFERYTPGSTPRFFMDQAGVFEVVSKAKGPGKALRQVVDRKGIEWPFHLNPTPESFLGDPNGQDYTVAVDAFIEAGNRGFVALFGRVGQVPQNANPPEGYALKVDADGWWELGTAKIPLASGRVPFAPRSWHRLQLHFVADRIAATIDGRDLGTVHDSTYPSGMAGIGCGWHHAQFDNLGITSDPADLNLALGCTATASSVWDVDHAPGNVTDGNTVSTRWSAAGGRSQGEWVAIEFPHPLTFDRLDVRQLEDRIADYKVQWWDGHTWQEACAGPTLGPGLRHLSFPPVTSTQVRLLVMTAKSTPSLWEIEVRNTRAL
jgi:galactosylceramidase